MKMFELNGTSTAQEIYRRRHHELFWRRWGHDIGETIMHYSKDVLLSLKTTSHKFVFV